MPLKAGSNGRARRALGVALIAGLPWVAPSAMADARPQERLEAIEAQLQALEDWLSSSRRDHSELQQQLRQSDLALATLAAEVRNTETSLTDTRKALANLNRRIETLEARQAEQQAALQNELQRAWLLARRGPLQTLLEAESVARAGRLLRFHEYLAQARLETLARHRETSAELESSRTQLAQREQQLAEERSQLQQQRDQLADARRDRARVLAQLEAEMAARSARKADLAEEREALEALLERLARDSFDRSGQQFANARGQLPWPLEAETDADKRQQRHGGLVLSAEEGAQIHAVHAGRVVFADWMRGYGLLIIVDHGGGYMSLYGQAESLLRQVGEVVQAGEPLATAGRSGGQQEAGIWFGIRHEGKPQPPTQWCR